MQLFLSMVLSQTDYFNFCSTMGGMEEKRQGQGQVLSFIQGNYMATE
jgi:hypothetical protein